MLPNAKGMGVVRISIDQRNNGISFTRREGGERGFYFWGKTLNVTLE